MCNFAAEAYAYAPQEIGAAYAERMRELPVQEFLQHLDQRLAGLHAVLLDADYAASAAALICQTAREVALEARQQA
jgi:hypothetical protein